MFAETKWLNRDEASLAYHYQAAQTPFRGVLLISHGLAEHSRRYRIFAEFMAARGYHVYAHDHRGHGETTAKDAPLGRFAWRDGVLRVLEDVVAVRDMAATAHPGLPIILFGHSMGGLIALNAVVRYPDKFDAVAIWNSNFAVGLAGRAAQVLLFAEQALKGSDVPSGLLPKLTFGAWGRSIADRKTEFDWLSRDDEQVARYIADPLCGFDASVSLWRDIFEMSFQAPRTDHLERLKKNFPIHLVGGGQDPATELGKAILWLEAHLKKHGLSNITTSIYPAMRHETLNEIGAEAAMSAFADWCDETVGKAPSERTAT